MKKDSFLCSFQREIVKNKVQWVEIRNNSSHLFGLFQGEIIKNDLLGVVNFKKRDPNKENFFFQRCVTHTNH